MKLTIASIIIFFIILSGCKKKEDHKIEYYHLSDSIKSVALFQKNSYWVYRNDSTGEIDSTYVSSEVVYDDFASYYLPNTDIIISYALMPLQSTIFQYFRIQGRLGNISTSTGYPFLASMFRFYNGCNMGSTAFVLHDDTMTNHQGENLYNCATRPNDGNDFFNGGGDTYVELGEHPQFIVNGLLFSKVRETRTFIYSSYSNANDTIDYYFSPGNGLVKVVLRVDTSFSFTIKRATISWGLLRYNIIK